MRVATVIISHGRSGDVSTLATLRRCGYTGVVKILIDNLDKEVGEYLERYHCTDGGRTMVEVFDKRRRMETDDPILEEEKGRLPLYARNEALDLARREGAELLALFDDDVLDFWISRPDAGAGQKKRIRVRDFDAVMGAVRDFMEQAEWVDCLAITNDGYNPDGATPVAIRAFGTQVVFLRVRQDTAFVAGIGEDHLFGEFHRVLKTGRIIHRTRNAWEAPKAGQTPQEGGMQEVYRTIQPYGWTSLFIEFIASPANYVFRASRAGRWKRTRRVEREAMILRGEEDKERNTGKYERQNNNGDKKNQD